MPELHIAELHCYPIKSCRGIVLKKAEVGTMGLRYDRQWMIVDEHGMFVAQRESNGRGISIASLCRLETAFAGAELELRAPDMPTLYIPLSGIGEDAKIVRIWDTACKAYDQGADVAAWLTQYLSRERPGNYRLVRMSEHEHRISHQGEGQLAFADGYPFLVTSEASLADLNRRLAEQLPMNRFRPNIVLSGCEPYAEDTIDRFGVGGIAFTGGPLCVRCPITTTNQLTAVRGKEPLRTLATYRRTPEGVIFGRNFNHRGTGMIAVGDRVEINIA
jgi:uncharacterized protein YcbX